MRRSAVKALTLLLAGIIAFSGMLTLGTEDTYAASKPKAPAKVTGVSASAAGDNSVTVRWKKVKKGASGYAVYCDGQLVTRVNGAKNTSYTVGGLESGTKYNFSVCAYKTYKIKKWLNKKTGKWQTKKPAKKNCGKSKKTTAYKNGKLSAAVKAKTTGVQPTGSRAASSLSQTEIQNEMINQINAERAAVGAPLLQLTPVMNELALEKAYDMYVNNYFSHDSPTWGSPSNQYKRANISGFGGENIAWNQSTVSEVMYCWMHSDGHRANILDPHFTHVGVAYYGGYWVQQFAVDPVDYTCPACGSNINNSDHVHDYYTATFAYPAVNPSKTEQIKIQYIMCNKSGYRIEIVDQIENMENKLTEWDSYVGEGEDCLSFITWRNSSGQVIPCPYEFEVEGTSLNASGIMEADLEAEAYGE